MDVATENQRPVLSLVEPWPQMDYIVIYILWKNNRQQLHQKEHTHFFSVTNNRTSPSTPQYKKHTFWVLCSFFNCPNNVTVN